MQLFIIGNGFDLYTGYKTSYKDFKDFLIDNEFQYRIGDSTLLDILTTDDDFEFWKNFEEKLSELPLDTVSYGYTENDTRQNSIIIDNIYNISEELYSLLQNALSDFIAEATKERRTAKEIFLGLFKTNDKFISFNYSLTLEKIYHISDNNIFHLHGICNPMREDEDNESIIFGHSGNIPDYLYADRLYDEENTLEYTKAKVREALTKTLEIIEFERFMGNISQYEEIQIIGHSLGLVDERYFEKINTSKTKKITYWQYISNSFNETEIITKLKRLFNRVRCEILYYDETGIQNVVEVR